MNAASSSLRCGSRPTFSTLKYSAVFGGCAKLCALPSKSGPLTRSKNWCVSAGHVAGSTACRSRASFMKRCASKVASEARLSTTVPAPASAARKARRAQKPLCTATYTLSSTSP
nr:hypothetical protein Milk-S104_00036 [Bovine alphaherpesvirus 1]WHT50328.1 hypothetical protein Docile-S101_00036 [Bovine alphaherpesvirus 1]